MESKKVSVVSPFIEKVFGHITVALLLLAAAGLLLNWLLEFPEGLWLTILGLPGGLIMFVLIYMIQGKCWTDSEGLVLDMPLQGSRTIPYSDITSAYISLKIGQKPSTVLEKRQLVHTLHIVTKSEDIHFSMTSGSIGSPSMLAFDQARSAALELSPFAEIVKNVKEHCGSNPMFDDISW